MRDRPSPERGGVRASGHDLTYRATQVLGRGLLRALRVQVDWTGVEHVPRVGPALLAITHVSYPDFVFVQKAVRTRRRFARFMTRHDVWLPGIGTALDHMQHVPVDRQAPAAAYLQTRRLLRAGEVVGGFPEAGISYSFTVRPLMRGMASLARETGVPVVPVAVWGTQRLFSVGDPAPPPDWTRDRHVDLAFGAPLHADAGTDLADWTRDLGHRLTDLLEGLQRLPHHQPRPGEVAEWHPAHLGGQAMTRRRALDFDVVPFSAVRPTWGPDLDAFGPATG